MNDKTSKQLLISKIERSIKKCEKHILRIEEALLELDSLLPLDENTYNNFDSSKIRATDQLLFRFSKLQDKISYTIIKSICDLLENTRENTTFIDYINIAEKYKILESAYSWEVIRTIRNNITHDYEDDIEYQIKTINDVDNAYKEILKVFDNIKTRFDKIVNQ